MLFREPDELSPWEWAKARRVHFTTPMKDAAIGAFAGLIGAVLAWLVRENFTNALVIGVGTGLLSGVGLPVLETCYWRTQRKNILLAEAADEIRRLREAQAAKPTPLATRAESSTGLLHAEWDKAESEAQDKKGKFIAAKVESASPPRQVNPIDLNTMISDWRAKVEQLTQPSSISELNAARVPLSVSLHWVNTPAHLEVRGTSRESSMLKGVECTLINVERYAPLHDKFVESQETHPDGTFHVLHLNKHNLFFDQPVSFGFIQNERHRISVAGNLPGPPCRLTTPAIWRFWFRLTDEAGRSVTEFLCAEWEGENKVFIGVICPGSVSRAHPPINPVRA